MQQYQYDRRKYACPRHISGTISLVDLTLLSARTSTFSELLFRPGGMPSQDRDLEYILFSKRMLSGRKSVPLSNGIHVAFQSFQMSEKSAEIRGCVPVRTRTCFYDLDGLYAADGGPYWRVLDAAGAAIALRSHDTDIHMQVSRGWLKAPCDGATNSSTLKLLSWHAVSGRSADL